MGRDILHVVGDDIKKVPTVVILATMRSHTFAKYNQAAMLRGRLQNILTSRSKLMIQSKAKSAACRSF